MQFFHDWYLSLDSSDQDILKATAGPTVAILIFVLTNLIQTLLLWRTGRLANIRLIVGIYKEISDNLAYGSKFLEDNVNGAIKARITEEDSEAKNAKREPLYRPLVGITESSAFYDAVAPNITSIKRKCLVVVANYYRSVTDQRQIASAIEGPSFLCISLESRLGTIDDLWTAFRDSTIRGAAALKQLRASYPERWFKDL